VIHGVLRALRLVAPPRRGRQPARVLVFGDSNSARPHGGGGRWTDLLQRRLSHRVAMINEGLDGRTTAFDSVELNGVETLPRVLAAHAPVDWLLLMLGTNDHKRGYGPPAPEDIVRGVDRLVCLGRAIAPDSRIMLITPPPMGRVRSPEFGDVHPGLAKTVAEMKRLAGERRLPCVDLFSALSASRHLERDGVHLNQKGRKAVAGAVRRVLVRELG